MRTAIQRIGNSQGVLIPKPLLAQLGFAREVELTVEDDALVIRKPASPPRRGWAEASKALAENGGAALAWPEFANDDNATFSW
ncbi:MAG: AbrB/MazE/SpoVT family DNA-binding domain-containing protein [Vulcanimicrobiaceae bacterium]